MPTSKPFRDFASKPIVSFAKGMFALMLLSCASLVQAAPAYNADSVVFTDAAPGTASITHSFTQTTGSGLILFVAIEYESATNWSATYNGAAMAVARRGDNTGSAYSDVFYLVNPATGANSVVYTPNPNYYTGALSSVIWSYNGASGIGASNANVATPSGSPWPVSVTITPTSLTSILVCFANELCSCTNAPTLAQTHGTNRLTTAVAQTNHHFLGFGDWAAASTSTVYQSLTYTASGCTGYGSNVVGQMIEVMASGGSPTDTPTLTDTPTPSPTFSASPTFSSSPTNSASPTASPSRTVTSTSSRTPTITPTFTATGTCTASPTSTPLMGLVKSANVSTAVFGSTITFALAYSNDSAAMVNITITDSVPATLTFVGADNGGTYSTGVVTWTISNVASYGSGTVHMWGTVSGYPLLPGYSGRHFAISAPADPWRPAFAFYLRPEEGLPSLE